jgi:hypothetical protein
VRTWSLVKSELAYVIVSLTKIYLRASEARFYGYRDTVHITVYCKGEIGCSLNDGRTM